MGKVWKQVFRCSLWSLNAGHDGGSIIFSWNFSDLPVRHCIKMVCTGGYVSYQENMTGFLAYLLFPAISIGFTENSDDCTLFA